MSDPLPIPSAPLPESAGAHKWCECKNNRPNCMECYQRTQAERRAARAVTKLPERVLPGKHCSCPNNSPFCTACLLKAERRRRDRSHSMSCVLCKDDHRCRWHQEPSGPPVESQPVVVDPSRMFRDDWHSASNLTRLFQCRLRHQRSSASGSPNDQRPSRTGRGKDDRLFLTTDGGGASVLVAG